MLSSTEWPQKARHCLRVGSLSDKRVIEACESSFDVLVVQGNLAVSAPQGIATWPLQKPIWIDPITYAFAASPDYLKSGKSGDYKRTFRKLAEVFGSPFTEALDAGRKVSPSDFATHEAIRSVTQRVLEWQQTVFALPEEDHKYGVESVSPVLSTVPYFPLTVTGTSSGDVPPWLRTNLSFVAEAAGLMEPSKLAVGFLADLDVFDHPNFGVWLGAYVDQLLAHEIKHLWWWISDHDEVNTSLQRAVKLLTSFQHIRSRGIEVHQAFGGSLSSSALSLGLTSVGHGVNYWEQKGWEPISTGGLPTARFFHPELRERLRVPEAIAIVDAQISSVREFRDRVCGCEICGTVVLDDISDFGAYGEVNVRTRRTRNGGLVEFDSPTPEALRITKSHYLAAKGREVSASLRQMPTEISEGFREDAEFWVSDISRTAHLDRWALALDISASQER